MTPHTWIIEEVDGGAVGSAEFYECSVCGACGGVVFGTKKPRPFLAGPALPLSEDCTVAYEEISKHLETKEWKRQQLDSMQRRAEQLVAEMKRYYGVTLAKGNRGLVYGSFVDRDGRAFQFESKENRTELRSVITWADGTVEEFRDYGSAYDKVHEYYSALVLADVEKAVREAFEPRGFTVHRAKTVYGSIYTPTAPPAEPAFSKSFAIKKPEKYEIFLNQRYPAKPRTILVDTIEKVLKTLTESLG